MLDIETLREGCYRLHEPIDNPKPDRRYRRSWTAEPQIAPGLFMVRVHDERHEIRNKGTVESTVESRTVTIKRAGRLHYASADAVFRREPGGAWTCAREQSLAWLMLQADAFRRDESLDAFLRFYDSEHHVDMRDVLLRLVAGFGVSADAVQIATVAQYAADNAPEDDER